MITATLIVQQPLATVIEINQGQKGDPGPRGPGVPGGGSVGSVLVKGVTDNQWLEVQDLTLWFNNQIL